MTQNANSLAIMKLLQLPGLGPAKVNALLNWGKSIGHTPAELCKQPEILKSRITTEQLNSLKSSQLHLAEELSRESVQILSIMDNIYPSGLLQGMKTMSPPIIYCRGNIKLLAKPTVGFSGSRKASEKGIDTARDCAEQLARNGKVIVSGYAAGVDTTAHTAALAAGGATIVVLPEGILNFRIKQGFEQFWDWDRVLVVSHLEPQCPWSVHNAMARNSIICALSNAMILIEAGATGGSIAAGSTCLKMGRPLFAPVYEGMPETAAGNRELLKRGALPLLKNRHTHRASIRRVLEAIETATLVSSQSKQISLLNV